MENKVVVITGASGGIGASIALKCAESGCRLALCGRHQGRLEAVSSACIAQGLSEAKILIVTGDLANDDDIDLMTSKITQHYQQVDVLVNNAGLAFVGGIEECNMSDFDMLYRVNLRCVIRLIKSFLPFLKTSKGNIVNISSEGSVKPQNPPVLAYCTIKAGLDQMTRCLAAELGPHGIRVNSVNPSEIKTDMAINCGICTSNTELDQFHEEIAKKYPLRRVGRPDDVAEAVVFLASEKASFITGTNMLVDGGSSQTTATTA